VNYKTIVPSNIFLSYKSYLQRLDEPAYPTRDMTMLG